MTQYTAKATDGAGWVRYDDIEDDTWAFLYARQMELIKGRACQEYEQGLRVLGLNDKQVPQLPDVNRALMNATGWQVEAVPALIPFQQFFELLAERKFPAATFIRTPLEIDYLQEPDIFHELFGHCPLLTDPVFADFVHNYGKLGVAASPVQRRYLARIFWFTVEFGLIKENNQTRIYGAGILSSPSETRYALEDERASRVEFNLARALRTPYRIDILQPQYFVIDSFNELFDIMNESIMDKIDEAIALGDYAPLFQAKKPPQQEVELSPEKLITSPTFERHDC
ncbi:MAG: phenylalanine 4-monooxygenase [Gammaproteobacteria bacterium]|nr:phenylalanine 4-monooxygenase [Gammaproteobacteria bacterium]NVK86682.1 phenylalanine 4-monooxygenase [Gammaproteobacteria bacterium]